MQQTFTNFMKSLPSDASSETSSTTMATDVSLSHTIDDDITFERVRHMPRRTQFVSNHRKLSWQFDKELKQHERDKKLSHVELSRAKTAMAEKLYRLQDAKKEVERKKSPGAVLDRRSSAPEMTRRSDPKDTFTSTTCKTTTNPMKHSHSASSFPVAAMIPEDTEVTHYTVDDKDRKVTFTTGPPDAQHQAKAGRRATIAEGATPTSNLPPHLVRRLSEFMDSTSALVCNSSSSGSGRGGKDSQNVRSEFPKSSEPAAGLSSESPEQLETEAAQD